MNRQLQSPAFRILLLLLVSSVFVSGRTILDPYEILGLPKSAGRQEVKKAFKELSRTYHPDRHPDDPGHKQRYHKIIEAYELIKQEWNDEPSEFFHSSDRKEYINIDDLLSQMQWEVHE
jgi:DnaJ-class molecular chaperone